MEHLSLGRPHELDLTVYECGICGKELRRSKGPDTKWEWHYFTIDGKHQRHYKSKCNLATPEQKAAFLKRRQESKYD